jgi:hypothetical protein
MYIVKRIKSLCNSFGDNNIYYINQGGCCVFANLLVKALMKHNIEAGGIVLSWEAKYFNENNNSFDQIRNSSRKNDPTEWNSNGVRFWHVAVEFKHKGKTYRADSDGIEEVRIKTKSEFRNAPVYNGYLTPEELNDFSSNKHRHCWNSIFDRDDIPRIQRLVEQHLSVDLN